MIKGKGEEMVDFKGAGTCLNIRKVQISKRVGGGVDCSISIS